MRLTSSLSEGSFRSEFAPKATVVNLSSEPWARAPVVVWPSFETSALRAPQDQGCGDHLSLRRHRPRRRMTQYSAASRFMPQCLRLLGPPPSCLVPGDDGGRVWVRSIQQVLDELAGLHDRQDAFALIAEHAEIRERIAVHHDEIGVRLGRDHADFAGHADDLGGD
jgi:hypothetical protein